MSMLQMGSHLLKGKSSLAKSRRQKRRTRRSNLRLESLESRIAMTADPLPVLMVIADSQDFYYQEYGDTRIGLEAEGVQVRVAATTTNPSRPHANTGEGSDGGGVTPDIALADVDADDYSAIVFVGGWGSSMYQYDFPGDYSNDHYDGDLATKTVVNNLINDFVASDKHVAAICHGVTVLAWARVDGVSPLNGRQVSVPYIGSPAVVYEGQYYGYFQLGQYEQAAENGAIANRFSGQYGDPNTVADDVVVDGRIITAENYDAALAFGHRVGREVLSAAEEPASGPMGPIVVDQTMSTDQDVLEIALPEGGDYSVSLLNDPPTMDVAVSVNGNVLLIDPAPGFVGQFQVALTVAGAAGASTHVFSVNVTESETPPPSDDSPSPLPVLLVISNTDFWYQDYADTRASIEAAGVSVVVAAATLDNATPHANSGQGSGTGQVQPGVSLADARAVDYSAIVFVGGWGMAQYQYGFEGTYDNASYNGSRSLRTATNDLINDFVDQDKYVAAVCYGVSVLAWARVDGTSLLEDHTVVGWNGLAPSVNGRYGTNRDQVEQNGATMLGSGAVGNASTSTDDVIVDGRIITAENYESASMFGRVVAEQVTQREYIEHVDAVFAAWN